MNKHPACLLAFQPEVKTFWISGKPEQVQLTAQDSLDYWQNQNKGWEITDFIKKTSDLILVIVEK